MSLLIKYSKHPAHLRWLFNDAVSIDILQRRNETGAVGGMRISRGNGNTRRNPTTVELHSSQIPIELTWDRTWASALGSYGARTALAC
jgi:hypothetical protein